MLRRKKLCGERLWKLNMIACGDGGLLMRLLGLWGLCQSCDGVVPQSCPLDWRWVMVLRSNLARCVVWRLDFEGSFSRIV